MWSLRLPAIWRHFTFYFVFLMYSENKSVTPSVIWEKAAPMFCKAPEMFYALKNFISALFVFHQSILKADWALLALTEGTTATF